MGAADCILDLVSSGTTLRENNLKEIEGGRVLDSQGCLVASREALLKRPGVLEIVHEMLERLEAHLRANGVFMVTANVRGSSAENVAEKICSGGSLLRGLQGPTVSPIYTLQNDASNTLFINMHKTSIVANYDREVFFNKRSDLLFF